MTEGGIWLLYGLELVAALCFMVGFRTRTAGVIALLVHALFSTLRLPMGYWGWAAHIQPLIVYVLFSQAGRYVSVDSWLARHSANADEHVDESDDWLDTAWPLRLLQIHTCTMYLVSGGERLDDPGWIHGQGLWIVLTNFTFSRFGYDWTFFQPALTLGSWFAFVIEPVAVVGL